MKSKNKDDLKVFAKFFTFGFTVVIMGILIIKIIESL